MISELGHQDVRKKTSTDTYIRPAGYFRRLGAFDWLFGAGLLAAALFALNRYGAFMDVYEKAILLAAVPTFATLGWHFKAVRWLMPLVAALSLIAIATYGGVLDMANKKFLLKYMLSSQSAILWMSALFVFSTVFYWIGLLARSPAGASIGSKLCWAARSARGKSRWHR